MASMRLLVAGAAGFSFFYVMKEKSRLYAISYGRHVYEGDEKRTTWDSNWDHRQPLKKEEKIGKDSGKNDEKGDNGDKNEISTATRHLILVRHGQYVMDKDPEKKILTELGRRQAIETGKRLQELNFPFTVLHRSTMVRAVETADIVSQYLPGVPVNTTEILCEGAPIKPEPAVTHWRPEHWFFQDGSRIETAFRQFFHRAPPEQTEDSYELLICHANVIRYFVCRSLQLPPEAWLRMSIGNCGITKISIRPNGRVSLREMGGTGHLPPELITFN